MRRPCIECVMPSCTRECGGYPAGCHALGCRRRGTSSSDCTVNKKIVALRQSLGLVADVERGKTEPGIGIVSTIAVW